MAYNTCTIIRCPERNIAITDFTCSSSANNKWCMFRIVAFSEIA